MSVTRVMRFEPGETEAQTSMRALLEDPDHPGRPGIVYWVARPLEPTLRGAGAKISMVSFFTLHRGALTCIDWPLWTFLQSCPAPLFAVRGGSRSVQPYTARERRFEGLALPVPLHPVQLVQHLSSVLWNDPGYLRHQQL